jgi:hypothetical protein
MDAQPKWLLYGRMNAVFERRKVAWKRIFHDSPWWLPWLISATFLALAFYAAIGSGRRMGQVLTGWKAIGLASSLRLGLWVGYNAVFRRTVVIFRKSHEAGGPLATVKGWWPYLVAGLLGAIASKFAKRELPSSFGHKAYSHAQRFV